MGSLQSMEDCLRILKISNIMKLSPFSKTVLAKAIYLPFPWMPSFTERVPSRGPCRMATSPQHPPAWGPRGSSPSVAMSSGAPAPGNFQGLSRPFQLLVPKSLWTCSEPRTAPPGGGCATFRAVPAKPWEASEHSQPGSVRQSAPCGLHDLLKGWLPWAHAAGLNQVRYRSAEDSAPWAEVWAGAPRHPQTKKAPSPSVLHLKWQLCPQRAMTAWKSSGSGVRNTKVRV